MGPRVSLDTAERRKFPAYAGKVKLLGLAIRNFRKLNHLNVHLSIRVIITVVKQGR